MPSLWSLFAAAVAIFAVCFWWITRSGDRKERPFTPINAKQHFEYRTGAVWGHLPIRDLKPISFEQLRLLSACNREWILVNVQSGPLLAPNEVAGIFVLSVSPGELPEVLRWLPDDRAVAFHGVAESSFALIESSCCMNSPKPRCILADLPRNLEIR